MEIVRGKNPPWKFNGSCLDMAIDHEPFLTVSAQKRVPRGGTHVASLVLRCTRVYDIIQESHYFPRSAIA